MKRRFVITISMLLFLFAFNAGSNAQESSGRKISPNSCAYSLLFDYTEAQLSEMKAIEFEQSAIISYSFPRYEEVKFILFDKYGKEIKTLVDGEQKPGSYNIDLASLNLESGVHYYQLAIGDDKDLRKIVINY